MPTPRLAAGLAVLVLGLPACAGDRRAAAPAGPTPGDKRPLPTATVAPAAGTIAAVTEHDGVVLAELTLGSRQGLEVGTLLRVHGQVGNQRTFKGMLQVTEVLAEQRAIARAIGLTDRSAPLGVGDEAVTADLGSAYADFRRDLAREREAASGADARQDAAFVSLREHYQNELALAAGRFAASREEDRLQHEREREALAAAHRAEIERIQAERSAELAAVRAALSEDMRLAIAADRSERAERLTALQNEITALTANTNRLGAELVLAHQTALDLQRDLAAQAERHQRELRAEVETRQILQGHVQRLESAQPGAAPVVPVLTRDPQRTETVLARLERTAAELAAAQARIGELERELGDERVLRQQHQRTVADATERIATLESALQRTGAAGEHLLASEQALKTARDQLARHELARLEAERLLFDVTARLLAADDAVALDALRERLRLHIAAQQADPQADPSFKAP